MPESVRPQSCKQLWIFGRVRGAYHSLSGFISNYNKVVVSSLNESVHFVESRVRAVLYNEAHITDEIGDPFINFKSAQLVREFPLQMGIKLFNRYLLSKSYCFVCVL